MQNAMEEDQAKAFQVQHRSLHDGHIRVRVMAGFPGLQRVLVLVFTIVSLISNPFLILSADFLSLNMSILLFLLFWGLWTFKRWAYWTTLFVEIFFLIRGVFIVILPSSSLRIGFWEGIALLCVLFLVASPNVRKIFFQKSKNLFQKTKEKGLAHIYLNNDKSRFFMRMMLCKCKRWKSRSTMNC